MAQQVKWVASQAYNIVWSIPQYLYPSKASSAQQISSQIKAVIGVDLSSDGCGMTLSYLLSQSMLIC